MGAIVCHLDAANHGSRASSFGSGANVVALSLRSTTEAVAAEILDAFLAGVPDPAESANIAGIE